MEGPRLVTSAEMPRVRAWLGEISGPRAPDDRALAPGGAAERGFALAFFEEDEPISLAHLVPEDLVILGRAVKAATLTALITRPDFRGQGLASLLLDYCLGLLAQERVRLLFVPVDRGLFRRMGCYPAGIIWKARLRRDELPPPGQAAVRAAGAADIPELQRLHAAEDPGFARNPEDFDLAGRFPEAGDADCRLHHFLIVRAGTNTACMAVMTRGEESAEGRLAGCAGDRRSIAGALRVVADRLGLAGLAISVPHHDRSLLDRLRAAGGAWETGTNPGAVGLLDPAGLWLDLLPGVAERIGENTARSICLYQGEDGTAGIRLGAEVVALHDSERLIGLFFGAGSPRWPDGHPLPPHLQRILSSCLPWPLPVSWRQESQCHP